MPGTRNSRPTDGCCTTLRKESIRLLPRRSGSSSVLSSSTRTKPGASPRGEQSAPSGPAVASMTSGDSPMKARSEEHTSELQSLMRISYACLCLKKKNQVEAHSSELGVCSYHNHCEQIAVSYVAHQYKHDYSQV